MQLSKEIRKIVNDAKSAGQAPIMATIAGQEYIYRSINRAEWRSVMVERNKGLKELEELGEAATDEQLAEFEDTQMKAIIDVACLYPSDMKPDSLPAGALQSLSEYILQESGFGGAEVEPIKL